MDVLLNRLAREKEMRKKKEKKDSLKNKKLATLEEEEEAEKDIDAKELLPTNDEIDKCKKQLLKDTEIWQSYPQIAWNNLSYLGCEVLALSCGHSPIRTAILDANQQHIFVWILDHPNPFVRAHAANALRCFFFVTSRFFFFLVFFWFLFYFWCVLVLHCLRV